MANQLISFGFYETITNSLTTEKYSNLNSSLKIEDNIRILNPLSNDLGILRRSMLFSGLESIAYNLNRQQQRLKLFEFGKTYCLLNGDRQETKHLSIVMTGPKDPMHWRGKGENIDFFYTKGIVSSLIEKIGIKKTKSFPSKNPIFDEGQSLKIGANKLVEFGLANSEICSKFGIYQQLYFIDFDWDVIVNSLQNTNVKFKSISKFPEVKRDLALLIDQEVSFNSIYEIAKKYDQKFLKEVSLFDVYNGENLPNGKKSYALSFTLQDKNKTLTDKEIDKFMSKLQKRFEREIGAELR